MKFRRIDNLGDWTFGKGLQDYAKNEEAIDLNIKTRILSWYGDCFFNLTEGVDWKNRLDKNQTNNLTSEIKGIILRSYGVVGINSFSNNLDHITRAFRIEYNITTFYSPSFQNTLTIGDIYNA